MGAVMIEAIIVGLLVLACALYWLGRLAPSVTRQLWSGLGAALTLLHAPAPMKEAVAGRAKATGRNGCGGCKGCDKNGSCH